MTLYSTLGFGKIFSGLLRQEAQIQCFIIKTTRAVFASQYSNKVDFISIGDTEMGLKGGVVPN